MSPPNQGDPPISPTDIGDRVDLGAALTTFRRAAGLSIRGLARSIDVPAGTVGGYLSGRHLPDPGHTGPFCAMLTACGIPASEHGRWLAIIDRIRAQPGPRAADQRSPYPGDLPFGSDDAAIFFGRSHLSDRICRMVDAARSPSLSPIVVVTGVSGAGVSSLLRAGVLPRLASDTRCLYISARGSTGSGVPDDDMAAIESACADDQQVVVVIDQAERLFAGDGHRRDHAGIWESLEALTGQIGADQRRRRVCVLAMREHALPHLENLPILRSAVASARIDVPALDEAQLLDAIRGPAAQAGLHVDDELVELLTADLAPQDVPGIVYEPGALSWLAKALRQTWNVSRRGRLTVADYQETGGLTASLRRAAEQAWSTLDDVAQGAARHALLRMVQVDEQAVVSRRRVKLHELVDITSPVAGVAGDADAVPAALTGAELSGAIAVLTDARIITVEQETAQISHPSVLTAWPRLAHWVDADRGSLRQLRRVTEAAESWRAHSGESSYLLRGSRLGAVEEWLSEKDPALTRLEQDYISASVAARTDDRHTMRRRRRQLQSALVLVAVLAVVAGALAVFGFHSRAVAEAHAADAALARNEAQSRELALSADRLRDSDPALAAQLSLVASGTADTVDARSALLDSTAVSQPTRIAAQEGPTSVALDSSAQLLAITNAKDGSVGLWSLASDEPTPVATIPSSAPGVEQFSAAISPDGSELAVGNADGLIQRWDISDPGAPVVLPGPGAVFPSGVLSLAYSPDGDVLAAGGAGDLVQRWDVAEHADARELTPLPFDGVVGAVAYSPDGSALWAGGDGGVLARWSVDGQSGAAVDPQLLTAGDQQIDAIAVGPRSRLVVTGDKAGAATVWQSAEDGEFERVDDAIAPLAGWLASAAFNPAGDLLALASTHNEFEVVSVPDFAVVMTAQHPGPVTSVLFDGDATVVSAATDGFVRVWPVPGPVVGPVGTSIFGLGMTNPSSLLVPAGSGVNALLPFDVADRSRPVQGAIAASPRDVALDGAFGISGDGLLAAAGTADGRVQLWDISDPDGAVAVGSPIDAISDLVQAVALSGDGSLLAVGGNDQRLALWDVSAADDPRELATVDGVGGQIYSLDFQPGGQLLAAGTTAGTTLLWDIADPAHPNQRASLTEQGGYIFGVQFSPDSALLAAAGADREVYLWDVTDPAMPELVTDPLTGATNQINGIAFSPDGSLLAAATSDGLVRVWDISDPASPTLWARLRAGAGVLYAVAFSPDGSQLLAAGASQRVWSWLTDVTAAREQLCDATGVGITASEWNNYVADRAYEPPCR